jgi:DNA/RNA-binding domain of Phe-tRNA-synthetase-like protein
MKISIHDELNIKIAYAGIKGVNNRKLDLPYNELCRLGELYKEQFAGMSIGSIPGVKETRSLFKTIGIDPTKHRPSSEALLNRSIKDKGFFNINTLVDIANWCSLEFLLPICVYDLTKIKGDIEIRKGAEGESYVGHNRRDVNLQNRFLVADEQGPFGSPITDSTRTAVDESTEETFLIIFAPESFDSEKLAENIKSFANRVIDLCGGEITFLDVMM